MNLMVVGGEAHTVRGSYTDRLAEAGASVTHHVYEAKKLRSIPPDVDAVLILADSIDHLLANKAVDLSKKKNIPFAYASRKATVALQTLRSKNFLPEGPEPGDNVSEDELREFALDYVCTELQASGRMPCESEIMQEISKVYPKASLDRDFYQEVQNRAQALVSDPKKTANQEQVQGWTTIILEDDPRFSLQPDLVVQKIQDLLEIPEIPEEGKKTVQSTIDQIRHMWLHHMGFSGGKEKREKAMRRWVYLLADEALSGGEEFPTSRELKTQCKKIFGIEPRPYSLVREERQAAAKAHKLTYDPFAPGKPPLPDSEPQEVPQEEPEKDLEGVRESINRMLEQAQSSLDKKIQEWRASLENLNKVQTEKASEWVARWENEASEIDETLSGYLDVAEKMVEEKLEEVSQMAEKRVEKKLEEALGQVFQTAEDPFSAFLDKARKKGVHVEITVKMTT